VDAEPAEGEEERREPDPTRLATTALAGAVDLTAAVYAADD
jgi:hypothetical protein